MGDIAWRHTVKMIFDISAMDQEFLNEKEIFEIYTLILYMNVIYLASLK